MTINGYAVSADGSWRQVTDEDVLAPGETFQVMQPVPTQAQIDKIQRIKLRPTLAYLLAKSIPNWATWTQAEWDTYFDANLSDAQVDLVTTLATARVMLKRQNLVIQKLNKLVIALRDHSWPDMPE